MEECNDEDVKKKEKEEGQKEKREYFVYARYT